MKPKTFSREALLKSANAKLARQFEQRMKTAVEEVPEGWFTLEQIKAATGLKTSTAKERLKMFEAQRRDILILVGNQFRRVPHYKF